MTTAIPFTFAKRYGVLMTDVSEHHATIICRKNPSTAILIELRRHLKTPYTLETVDDETFNKLLVKSYETDTNTAMQMAEDLGESMNLADLIHQLPKAEDLLEKQDDAPIIRLLNALLSEAIKDGASDVHIETFEDRISIRFRIDGILRDILEPQRVLAPLIVSRIKVMAKLDIAEKRLPQDGRITLRIAGRAVDVRVSTMPTSHGERVVLRLLDKQNARLDLAQLGMDNRTLGVMIKLIAIPHGIILVTGPTGSGKSTTLAAMVDFVNTSRANHIITIEDPIEYIHNSKKSTVNQLQIGRDTDSFSTALRSSLRQDPNIIMLGEMRDLESIRLALTAAETGHLVLSTLHASTAAITISRIVDIFPTEERNRVRNILSETIQGVICQTLVKKVSGGRVAAYEVLLATHAVRHLISQGMSSHLESTMQTSGDAGMFTLETSMKELVAKGLVSKTTYNLVIATRDALKFEDGGEGSGGKGKGNQPMRRPTTT